MAYDAAYHSEYYQAHKERKRATARAWEAANPEKVAAMQQRKAEKLRADPAARAKRLETAKAWEHSNPEAVLLRAARNRARRDGHEFDLTREDIQIPEVCPLLGIPIVPRRGGHGPQDASPSLDRIDNTKGYVKGNVWVLSWLANKMKCTASRAQLLTFAHNVQKLLESQNAVDE